MNKQIILITITAMMVWSCGINKSSKNKSKMKHSTITQEDALRLIQPFYDYLGGESTSKEVRASYHDDWVSYYDNESGRSMDETLGFVSGPLAQMIPDLKWEIKEIYITPQNQIIVRGEAKGTPVGDSFMGTTIQGGKSFTLMSIDIHELRDGKIAKTYHVEDWLNAIQQVASQQ